ncbi:hypothetical protein [Corallococcus exiguus]|uniref:hypothetical protein n=1 Tax=Corallococcus exiguus TaxID=83462 RepID=UPI001494EB5F|nr:hypothetical protein [Corallococcus exiguus]NPD27443.1 hypothetical protein [Corallococcus exiguus]
MSQANLDKLIEMLEEKIVPKALVALKADGIFWMDELFRPAHDVLRDLLSSRGARLFLCSPLPTEGVFVLLTKDAHEAYFHHLEAMAVEKFGQPES